MQEKNEYFLGTAGKVLGKRRAAFESARRLKAPEGLS